MVAEATGSPEAVGGWSPPHSPERGAQTRGTFRVERRAPSSLTKTFQGNGDAENKKLGFGPALPPLGDLEQACHPLVLSLPVCKMGQCCLSDCKVPSSRATSISGAGRAGSLTAGTSGGEGESSWEWPSATEPSTDPLPPTPFLARGTLSTCPRGAGKPGSGFRNGFWEERSWKQEEKPGRICGRSGATPPPAPAPASRGGPGRGDLLSRRAEAKKQGRAPRAAGGSGAGVGGEASATGRAGHV